MSQSHDSMIAVIAAHRDGHKIEERLKNIGNDNPGQWSDNDSPVWDFWWKEYRIKPLPPKPREWWMVTGTDGQICDKICPHYSLKDAESHQKSNHEGGQIIHVIEVLPSSGEPPLTQPKPTASP